MSAVHELLGIKGKWNTFLFFITFQYPISNLIMPYGQ